MEALILIRSLIKCAKEPWRAALRMGMSREGSRLEMGPASRRWALIPLSCSQRFTSSCNSWCLRVSKLTGDILMQTQGWGKPIYISFHTCPCGRGLELD